MELKEYLEQNGWSAHHFSKLIKLSHQTILNLLKGGEAQPETARKIYSFTKKKVKVPVFSATGTGPRLAYIKKIYEKNL